MGLNFKILVIWKALSTMSRRVPISATGVRPGSFGSAGSRGVSVVASASPAPSPAPALAPARKAAPLAASVTASVARGEGAARAESPSTHGSTHRAEHRVAAPSTPRSSHRAEHCVATDSGKFVSMADFEKLSRKFEALERTTTETGSRLANVEEHVRETRGGMNQILALLREGKNEQKTLPAPPKRKEIMAPPIKVLTESSESEYDSDETEQVSYGPEGAFSSTVVTKWGGKRKQKSTPVACKSGSAVVSSSERNDLSRTAGGGAMVVASKFRPAQPLPLPETLGGGSRNERSSSPKAEKLRGTGLIQCTDLNALVALMERDGYTEVPVIVKRTKEVSVHFKTAIANAHKIGEDEAQLVAMLSADSARSASRIPDACQIRKEVIDCFSPKNVGMFMQFFACMAENYNSRSDKGVVIEGHLYSYVVLGTDKKICTSFLKYLSGN
jgi:hypothetical protein